jgi:hypothetical protein
MEGDLSPDTRINARFSRLEPEPAENGRLSLRLALPAAGFGPPKSLMCSSQDIRPRVVYSLAQFGFGGG